MYKNEEFNAFRPNQSSRPTLHAIKSQPMTRLSKVQCFAFNESKDFMRDNQRLRH